MPGVSKKRLLLALGGIVVVAAISVVIVLASGRHDARPAPPAGDTVKLEIRAKPVATIKLDGHAIGRSPQVLVVKRGTTPMEIEASFVDEKYKLKTGEKATTYLRETRVVVPSESQSVDFDVKDAKPLETAPADMK